MLFPPHSSPLDFYPLRASIEPSSLSSTLSMPAHAVIIGPHASHLTLDHHNRGGLLDLFSTFCDDETTRGRRREGCRASERTIHQVNTTDVTTHSLSLLPLLPPPRLPQNTTEASVGSHQRSGAAGAQGGAVRHHQQQQQVRWRGGAAVEEMTTAAAMTSSMTSSRTRAGRATC